MFSSAILRLFLAVLRKLAFGIPKLVNKYPLELSKRLWALLLLTAQRLFGSRSSPTSIIRTSESTVTRILDPSIIRTQSHDGNISSPTPSVTTAQCLASTRPERVELEHLNLIEEGLGLTPSEYASSGEEGVVSRQGGWIMVPCLPHDIKLYRYVGTITFQCI